MRKFLLRAIFMFLLATPCSYAQGKGIAEGRIVDRTDASIIPRGVELDIIALDGGMSIIKTGISDAAGKFKIEGLPEDRNLIARVSYKNTNYHSMLTFKEGKAFAEIAVYEPASTMKDIDVEGAWIIAFQLVDSQLKAVETVRFNNKTNPPRTYAPPDGTFRISKSPGILEPPQIRASGPGSSMPLVQAALESADGKSYYSLYPLRPGQTTFEVQQILPYENRSYHFVKKFFNDVKEITVGVTPPDMMISGNGLSKIETNANFIVYKSAPVKAGTEIAWDFSGGTATPPPEAAAPESEAQSEIKTMPNAVGRNAVAIGALLLMAFIIALWISFNKREN